MVIHDLKRFNELAESCGNRYLAIRWVSEWARSLGSTYSDYHLIESKLLEWVITGKCPYSKTVLTARRVVNDIDHIDDFLSWVMDEEVVEEVKTTYKESVRHHRLLEYRDDTLGQSRKDRVNVLLRMIWFSTGAKGDLE